MFSLSLLLRYGPIILAFVAGVLFTTKCTPEKRGEESPKVVTVIKTDTLFIPKVVQKTVYVTKPTLVTIYKDRIIPVMQADSTPTLSVRRYVDSLQVLPKVQVAYDAEVTGTLDHINLSYKDTRPQMIVEKVVTTTITNTKHPAGLYAGFSGQLDGSRFGPSLTVVTSTFLVGATYNLVRNNFTPSVAPIQLSLGFKLGAK